MELIEAEHPRPGHVLLHLSDSHLLGGPEPLYGAVDSEAHLRQLFSEVHASKVRPDAVIFTGDLADQGEPGAYAKLRSIVEPACREMGARVIWAMGNHDDRANFRAGLFDQSDNDAPVDHSYFVNGLRIITLDTSVPGFHHGELSQSQLDWLESELATPAPDGTILALHHPPVPSVLDLSILVELRGQAALADVVRNSDIRSILGGHLHYSTMAMFAGVRYRWLPRAATRRTSMFRRAAPAAGTVPRHSTWSTFTSRRSFIQWCRWANRLLSVSTSARKLRGGGSPKRASGFPSEPRTNAVPWPMRSIRR
ncbi:3',5'-cyclic adenosine monophosphate phosphodiesterase CpdA [Arthrobacter sp. Hiyo8]|nr:3',5'-cyclic adenosine monophosphate phosphodiesterase CpdA [Arthrobacter sp. Hiyo8]